MNRNAHITKIYHCTPENKLAVIDLCCYVGDITREQLLSKSRLSAIVLCRAIAAKIMRERMKMSLVDIGAALAPKNQPKHHSTILHALHMLDNLLFTKDDRACRWHEEAMLKVLTNLSHGQRVLVYIPDGDNGELLAYLYKQDYRHEILE